MTEAAHIPTFGYNDEIDMTRLVELRSDIKRVTESAGVRFSYMPIIVKVGRIYIIVGRNILIILYLLHDNYTKIVAFFEIRNILKFCYLGHWLDTDVCLQAVSLALTEFPILNSIVDANCENITYKVKTKTLHIR